MPKLMTPLEFKQLLEKQILIFDGAMGTLLESYSFDDKVFGGEEFQMLYDLLAFSRPQTVKEAHLRYFQAGANVVETNTFGSSPLRLEEFDFSKLDVSHFNDKEAASDFSRISAAELAYRLNKRAAEVARQALEEHRKDPSYDSRPLFIAGAMGPSNRVVSATEANLKKADFREIEKNFRQQALGLIDGGVDILLLETQQDILEVKAAVFGLRQAMREKGVILPIMVHVAVDRFARMPIFHTDIKAAIVSIQDIGIDAFGLDCGVGPEDMPDAVQALSRLSKPPISVLPNAGFPHSENGRTVYKLEPKEMADYLKTYIEEQGVNIVGGCCGTTPDHIRAVAEMASRIKPKPRRVDNSVYISGPQKAVKFSSDQSLILIGERLNVRGSKKVREAVENSNPINHSALEEVVSQQTRELGLEIIDVCMDSNVVDTGKTLAEVVRSQTLDFPAAMSLDSFEVKALEKALMVYPGRPIINSISLEESEPGFDRLDMVLEATKDHAPLYIALLTESKGPAVRTSEKVELARRIVEKAQNKYGVKPEQLIIDVNIFPAGSETEEGLNFAKECLLAIAPIKKLAPGIKTIAGVGNLTSGLAKKPYMRKALTSVFLDKAQKQGLDAVIVNPNHYVPADTLPPSDRALAEKVIMEGDMDAFGRLEEIALSKKGAPQHPKVNYDDMDTVSAVRQKIKSGFKQRSSGVVNVNGFSYKYKDAIALQLAEIIKTTPPLSLINDHLMPVMEELGQDFAAGMVSLPHLIKSADVIKQGMNFLEAYIKYKSAADGEKEKTSKGVVILGTVYQDVHNIGKDLTKTLMENHGFEVVDLGVQVPHHKFIEAARERRAIAIGMSALLVQTANHMVTISSMLKEQNMENIPVLIGGASVNQRHAAYVAMAGETDQSRIRDNVFYCRSVMDGVNYLNQLINPDKRVDLFKNNKQKLIKAHQSGVKSRREQNRSEKDLTRRRVIFKNRRLAKAKFVPIQKLEYSLKDFASFLDKDLLFTLNWKYGSSKNWEKRGVSREELESKLEKIIDKSDANQWIRPQAVFASFPCRRDQNMVTALEPKSKRELGAFIFNDVIAKDRKEIFSVAQYFHPQEDIIGLQLAGAGFKAENLSEDRETRLLVEGLAHRVAEDMAKRANHVLSEMVFGKDLIIGRRYSPGFPSMTEMENNRLIAELLQADKLMKVELTESWQFSPTATTAAVICFHPEASFR